MIGRTVGGYRIVEQIGQGKMATVYKAFQSNMQRYVALKILPERYARDRHFVERFIREAQIVARLEHHNILPVYDFGEDDGIIYLSMRYLTGGTLKTFLTEGHLMLADAANVLNQVGSALHHAHRHGVLHRDVKPGNILLSFEGTIYLTDFGIAKVLGDDSGPMTTRVGIGTPTYMAPEQSQGQAVDERSDIYSLGVTLYEMVVGRPPFEGDTPQAVALAHIQEPPPPPRQLRPSLPDSIEAVIIKALAKNPGDRYQTAVDMARDFSEAVRDANRQFEGTALEVRLSDLEATLPELTKAVKQPAPAPTPQIETSDEAPADAPGSQRRVPLVALGIGGLVVVGLIAALLSGILSFNGRTGSPAGDNSADPVDTVEIEVQRSMHDDFEDAAFDGTLNRTLWLTYGSGCVQKQEDGQYQVTKLNASNETECGLTPIFDGQLPTGRDLSLMQGRAQIASDHQGLFVEQDFSMWAWIDNEIYIAICGLTAHSENNLEFLFTITDNRYTNIGRAFVTEPGARYDTWYTFRFEVDPNTMTFTCTVDGQMLGSYTPDDPEVMQDAEFELRVHTWQPSGAIATTYADDVTITLQDN